MVTCADDVFLDEVHTDILTGGFLQPIEARPLAAERIKDGAVLGEERFDEMPICVEWLAEGVHIPLAFSRPELPRDFGGRPLGVQ